MGGGGGCLYFDLPLLESHKDGTDQKQGTGQMNLCDHKDCILFVLEICAYWPGGLEQG